MLQHRGNHMSSLNVVPKKPLAVLRSEKNGKVEDARVNLSDKDLPSLESLQQFVAGLSLTINSTLGEISSLAENGESLAHRLSGSEEKERLQEYFLTIRKEHGTVATIAESIIDFTRLISDQLAGIAELEQ
jgi:signal transduction histidine kinase